MVSAVLFSRRHSGRRAPPPEHRYHQNAARGVLKALLPETGTDMKGHMRSYDLLLIASGYFNRPKDFDDLIRILDSELRLITPTDPQGKDVLERSGSGAGDFGGSALPARSRLNDVDRVRGLRIGAIDRHRPTVVGELSAHWLSRPC